MEAKQIITKCYKAVLSTKDTLKIDPDEIPNILLAIQKGTIVKVWQGIINTSFLVAIVPDEERRTIFLEDTKYEPERRSGGMKSLKDIFEEEHIKLPAPKS